MAPEQAHNSSPVPRSTASPVSGINVSRRPNSRADWFCVLGTAWFLAVLVHFLFVNPWGRPLWTAVPASLLEVLLDPGPFLSGLADVAFKGMAHAWFLGVFGLVGWVYVRRRMPEMRGAQRLCLSVLLGMVLVGLPLHLLGSVHQLGRWQTLATPLLVTAFLLIAPKRSQGQAAAVPHRLPTSGKIDRWITRTAWTLTGLISVLTFYHSLGFPVDYWDALIYYVEYAQRSWEQNGFPTVVCAQVGIGLGANYPHLFHVLQVLGAHMAGRWSDLYGQILPPVLGLVTIGLVAGLLRSLFGSRTVTALGVLAFRALPFGFTYHVWVSDYSLVMACTVGFFFCLERFFRCKEWGWFEGAALLCTAMPYINYLGWIYFPLLGLAPFLLDGERMSLADVIRRSVPFMVAALFLATPWYIRNIIVTGNPVYAFFHSVLDGKRIDPLVMRSCRLEWLRNGDGPAQLGRSFGERIISSPRYFFLEHPSWKLGPLFNGLLLPGLILGFVRREQFGTFVLMVTSGIFLFVYEFLISGIYLYHALGFLPVFACLAMWHFSSADSRHQRVIAAAILLASLCPGLSFALIGPKFNTPRLTALRYGSMERDTFYRIRYAKDSPVWERINTQLEKGAKILTHENRYHLFRRDITLIHLDDWEISRLYGKPFDQVVRQLRSTGIKYYLRIPNEANHPVVARLGHNQYLDNPNYFQEIISCGGSTLYRITGQEDRP